MCILRLCLHKITAFGFDPLWHGFSYVSWGCVYTRLVQFGSIWIGSTLAWVFVYVSQGSVYMRSVQFHSILIGSTLVQVFICIVRLCLHKISAVRFYLDGIHSGTGFHMYPEAVVTQDQCSSVLFGLDPLCHRFSYVSQGSVYMRSVQFHSISIRSTLVQVFICILRLCLHEISVVQFYLDGIHSGTGFHIYILRLCLHEISAVQFYLDWIHTGRGFHMYPEAVFYMRSVWFVSVSIGSILAQVFVCILRLCVCMR